MVKLRAVPVLFTASDCAAGSADPTWYLKLRLAGAKVRSGAAALARFASANSRIANVVKWQGRATRFASRFIGFRRPLGASFLQETDRQLRRKTVERFEKN